uniref:Uncharacterized protein n=1 Tax=Arundo donax TaxID=35708 RepID=A0A0A9EDK9_ARUDO
MITKVVGTGRSLAPPCRAHEAIYRNSHNTRILQTNIHTRTRTKCSIHSRNNIKTLSRNSYRSRSEYQL